ncbi:DUF1697 domain-containing protein [Peptostreptococcus porci]|uniref:DUF1697 domain-containing protein n=1 Tax=Peptostreptococcus porci TaxID=2652282 RepID=UPI002A825305|nr:DUF1697 domain-containing protein [Peptostreptococcus porci]MDY4127528.1 DUF1697 domain-containing protein [Peptostreptococcus porci]
MEIIALLRGVTPTGKNRIPKMSFLVEILEKARLKNVKTYIQSGNVILETELSKGETAKLIHDTIAKEIGANLSVIIKEKNQLQIAIKENPFNENYDFSRIHLVFTNDKMGEDELKKLENKDFGDERFVVGSECLYMYLPRSANTKKLNTNYLEKQLSITMTMRKLNVVKHLVGLCEK